MKFYILIFTIFTLLLIGKALETEQPTKPNLTQIQDKCPSNTFEPIKLTGAIGSVTTDSVTTDKLNFPMWCPLIEDKPRNWGTKK